MDSGLQHVATPLGAAVALLKYIFGLALGLWDFFMSPKTRAQRAKAEADKAIANHDEKAVNDLLNRNL